MIDKELSLGSLLTSGQIILTSLQQNELFQNIQFGLTLASAFVTFAYTLYKWYKRASKDKKLTKDEIDEGIGIIADAIDYVEDKINERGENND